MNFKETIKNFKHSKWLIGRAVYQSIKPFWVLKRFFTDINFRTASVARWRFKDRYYQRSVFTALDRYPLVFEACKQYLSTRNNLKILSFGCSTGEEVLSIGSYMPNAVVFGVDINDWCIKECLKKNTNPNFHFFQRFSKRFEDATDFDAIFCMAVFQRAENRLELNNNMAKGLTFDQFEQEISMLDSKLKLGGLLIIDNADFSFADTACSVHYQPLDFDKNKLQRNRPLFDRNNVKISETQNNYRVFVKE